MDRTAQFYSAPTYHFRGAGFPVYAGSRRQRGGSILGALRNFAMPIFNKIKQKALNESFGLAKGLMYDAVSGKDLKQSLLKRGSQTARNVGVSLAGDALRSIRKRTATPTTTTRRPTKRKANRRPAGSKQIHAKKRRVANNF